MENASKALIIAASVLVAILIISMGITIFNKAQSAGDTTDLDTTEINMFNSKFERYNNNQLGSQVKSLISFAISNANTNKDDPVKLPTIALQTVKEDGNGGLMYVSSANCITADGNEQASGDKITKYIEKLGDIRGKIISTKNYEVVLDYGNSGLINGIKIYEPYQ